MIHFRSIRKNSYWISLSLVLQEFLYSYKKLLIMRIILAEYWLVLKKWVTLCQKIEILQKNIPSLAFIFVLLMVASALCRCSGSYKFRHSFEDFFHLSGLWCRKIHQKLSHKQIVFSLFIDSPVPLSFVFSLFDSWYKRTLFGWRWYLVILRLLEELMLNDRGFFEILLIGCFCGD